MVKIKKSRLLIILLCTSLALISLSIKTVYCYFTCGENILGKTNNSGKEISTLTISYYNSIITGNVTVILKEFSSSPTIVLLDKDGSKIVNRYGNYVTFDVIKGSDGNYRFTFDNSTYKAVFIQVIDNDITRTIDSNSIIITNN